MKIQQVQRHKGTEAQRHKLVFRLLFLTLIITHSSILSLPFGEGWGGVAKAQNSYTLPTASCQSQCGVETALDGWISFMCHNLGADESLDPNTFVWVYPGIMGSIFQWGRPADGHQLRFSSITDVLSTTDVPGHDMFIANSNRQDWRDSGNNALWGTTKTANDPCPAGYKVPSSSQLSGLPALVKTWTGNGYRFNSGSDNLYLPAAGYRSGYTGSSLGNGGGSLGGQVGGYWSSTPDISTWSYHLGINSVNMNIGIQYRNMGFSVRCVAE